MKRALLLLIAISFPVTGCQTYHGRMAGNSCKSCKSCGPHSADVVPRIPIHQRGMEGPAGPSTGAYAYPYYTTRGPRDFLMDNPGSIGP